MQEKNVFAKGEIFHVFNKSVANFGIFKDSNNSMRFYRALSYYNSSSVKVNLGTFLKKSRDYHPKLLLPEKDSLIKMISYIFMSDHYHLLLKILKEKVFSKYMSDVENSYSRYFNIKFDRKGPLWQGRFKAVRIKTNEQLLHVSRYIHLNSTTAYLTEKPEEWIFSSYKEIISNPIYLRKILTEISFRTPTSYKKFVEDNIDYQRKLRVIKKLIID